MKAATLITLLINSVFTKHHHHLISHHHPLVHILKFKENIFSETNERIQNVMNKLFDTMNLRDQFVDEPKVKLLLTMLYDLKNIASNNFDLYNVLINVTRVEANTKAINRIRLDEMVRETVNGIQLKLYNRTRHKNRSNVVLRTSTRAATFITKHMQPMSEFKDSKEFKTFIGSFLKKVNDLTVDDLFKKKQAARKLNTSRRNLKVWEPPADLKAWYNSTLDNRRIFKGKKTNIETFPFIASVHILDEFMCAGNVIMKDLVITAASCVQIHFNNRFYRENPRTTVVRIGSDWATRRGEIVRVLEIYFYPVYDPKTLRNNIAILRLGRTIKFVNRRRSKVRRIELDPFDGNLPSNTHEVVILGWGAKKPTQIVNYFEKLQVSFLEIYPIEECRQIYSKEFVTENNFCAGYISKGSGACNRDVGGPGVVGGHLAGIVSFGPPVCGAVNAPTVFTRVGNYREWIESIMQTRPPRYGAPKTTRMTSRAFIYYYNTMTARTLPVLKPIMKSSTVALRAQADNNDGEENLLTEIITDFSGKNDSLVYDVINEAFTEDDFYDTTVPTVEEKKMRHSTHHKKKHFKPAVEYESTFNVDDINEDTTAATTHAYKPFIGVTGTTHRQTQRPKARARFTRRKKTTTTATTLASDVYDNENYESASQEGKNVTQIDDFASADTEERLVEYIEEPQEEVHKNFTNKDDYASVESDAHLVEYLEEFDVTVKSNRDVDQRSNAKNTVPEAIPSKHALFIDITPAPTAADVKTSESEEMLYEIQQ